MINFSPEFLNRIRLGAAGHFEVAVDTCKALLSETEEGILAIKDPAFNTLKPLQNDLGFRMIARKTGGKCGKCNQLVLEKQEIFYKAATGATHVNCTV